MSIQHILLTLACMLGIAIGQILFKQAAQASIDAGGGMLSFVNGWLIAALILYGGATILWIYILRVVRLDLAYPLFALAFVIVPVLAHYVFGDPFRTSSVIGGLLIVVGVFISTRGAV